MNLIIINIGDVYCRVFCDSKEFLNKMINKYKFFIEKKPCRNNDIVNIVIKDINETYNSKKALIVKTEAPNTFFVTYQGSSAKINSASRTAEVVLSGSNVYIFDSLLRIILSFILLKKKGFLLHSSGILEGKNGYVFCGVSGSGKSTISKFAGSRSIMSDELLVLRQNGSKWCVFSTPFNGEMKQKTRFLTGSVKKMFFLNKSRNLSEEILNNNNALKKLLRNILFFAKDKENISRIFGLSHEFIKTVPCYKLNFLPDNSYLKYVR